MARKTLCSASILAALVVAVPDGGLAQSIYEATLVEPGAKTPEISTTEMRRVLTERSALVIDARSRAEFEAGHIPGARVLEEPSSAQVSSVERLVAGDKAAAIVLYCNGPFCQASRRLGERLAAAGFSNVRRYQLGMPIWRALGGPTAIGLDGIKRVFAQDRTAVFFDARSAEEFARGSLPGARNIPPDKIVGGRVQGVAIPEDDFNTRIILFGRDGPQARALAEAFSRMPWHNVSYFPGSFAALAAALR